MNFDILASNKLATKILVICDNTIPNNKPKASDIKPIINVSIKSSKDIAKEWLKLERYEVQEKHNFADLEGKK